MFPVVDREPPQASVASACDDRPMRLQQFHSGRIREFKLLRRLRQFWWDDDLFNSRPSHLAPEEIVDRGAKHVCDLQQVLRANVAFAVLNVAQEPFAESAKFGEA